MLISVDVTTVLALTDAPFHNLHWKGTVEFSLDCFVCERLRRTTRFELGAERALCSGSRDGTGPHDTAARVAAFDHTHGRDATTLYAVLDYWWAPFKDERDSQPATPLTRWPWVRLQLGYHCPHAGESGEFSTQTNLVRPSDLTCKHCSVVVARTEEVPHVRLRP